MRFKFYMSILIPLLLIVLLFILSNYIFLFPSIKNNMLHEKKRMIKELTHVTIEIIDNCSKANKESLPINEIKTQVLEQIRNLNYGDNNKSYFWISDLTPRMVMHPYRKDLEGSDLSNYQDINGFKLFSHAVDIVNKNSEGYLEYYWQWQDDTSKILPKITYVKVYKEWGWIVGTGVYIDDIEIELRKIRKNELKSSLIITFLVLIFMFIVVQYGIKLEKQRLTAQQKTKLSEEKFRNLFQNSNDIIVVSNLTGVILDINNKALTTYGLKYEEIVGKTTYEMMPEKYHNTIKERVKSSFEKDLPPIEIELTPNKNQCINVEIKSTLLEIDNKKVLLSTMRDITSRKIQRKKLLESRLHYKIVADYTSDWEQWVGTNGEFKYISPSCERISGYEPDEFIRNPKLFEEIILKEDLNKWNIHQLNAFEHKKRNEVIEFRIRHKEGKVVWIEHSCQPVFDNNKNYIGARGSNRDITMRKKAENKLLDTYNKLESSEKKFKTLSDITFEGIIMHYNGLILEMNLSFSKMFGYEQKELLMHINPISILFDKESQKRIRNNIATNNNVLYEVTGIKKDGSKFPIEIEAKDYYNEEKGDSLRVAAFRDITERKMHEKHVFNAIISGEEKERTRIAKELHDGLGPYLSTMKFYFQWLAESNDDKKKKIIIEKGNESMHEAITILKEISNNLNPHILTNYGLMDAIAAFISKFDENDQLTFEFYPVEQIKISHNIEVALYRVVIELINNTLKHARASKIYITFKKTKNNYLKLIYADNGIGFDYNRIKDEIRGSGMLNIKNRISSLDGVLEITTSPNKGFIAKTTLKKF